ncbi:EF-hand domain-containing protein [Luteimonas sp. A478]
MKTTSLFAATVIALGALSSQAFAADPAQVADRAANASERADASETQARRGGKHHHRGHRFGHAGPGMTMGGGIARLDTDGDGRISRAELEQAAQARTERAERTGRTGKGERGQRGHRGMGGMGGGSLLEQFDAIDTNSDGYIVRTELRAWQQAQRPQREAERERRFQERFTAADLNGDGVLSRVEVEEKMPRLLASFAWMDDNRDGFLSQDELRPQRTLRTSGR